MNSCHTLIKNICPNLAIEVKKILKVKFFSSKWWLGSNLPILHLATKDASPVWPLYRSSIELINIKWALQWLRVAWTPLLNNFIARLFGTFHIVHLYSTFRILLNFQMLLYNFSFSCSGHFFQTVSFHFSWGGATPYPINSLGSIQVCHLILSNTSFSFGLSMQHSFTHSLMADRSIVVGHIQTVHMHSFMCTSHIGMTAHTPAFLWVGQYSGNLFYGHMTKTIAKHNRCQSHLSSHQCISDGHSSKY